MVEIRVDTKKDSREDIKKAVQFLQQYLAEDAQVNRDVFSSPEPEVSNNAFNIFNQEPEPPVKKEETEEDDDTDLDIKPMFY